MRFCPSLCSQDGTDRANTGKAEPLRESDEASGSSGQREKKLFFFFFSASYGSGAPVCYCHHSSWSLCHGSPNAAVASGARASLPSLVSDPTCTVRELCDCRVGQGWLQSDVVPRQYGFHRDHAECSQCGQRPSQRIIATGKMLHLGREGPSQ